MINRPIILVTNDDGIYAPGIKHLWKVLAPIANVFVVAPANEQSAVSMSITIRHPLRIEKASWSWAPDAQLWSINGTPADCVKLALNVILPSPPQIIVSGINRGSNAGRNVLYSGTVAAVIEGVIQNIPGVAFSIADYFNPDYEKAGGYIPSIVDYLLQHPLPNGTFLNVNFPKQSDEAIKGMRFTRQGMEYWAENPEKREHPGEGNSYYWLGARIAKFDEDNDCDIALLNEGYATAVPIRISDLTHHHYVEQQRKIFDKFMNDSFV